VPPSERKIQNLVEKLRVAAAMSQAYNDAIVLANDAFYDAFGMDVPCCCPGCTEGSKDSAAVKLQALFWEFIDSGESSVLEDPCSAECAADMMERLVNELESEEDE